MKQQNKFENCKPLFSVKSNSRKASTEKRVNRRENKFHNFGKSEAAKDKEKVASLFHPFFFQFWSS